MTFQNDALFKRSLLLLILLILGMVIIGGLARLTGSGLSIVEWKPMMGVFPPLTALDWEQEFAKYQGSPEFQKINFGMTLAEFQSIFWIEYIHRLWGRLLGIVLCIPTFLMIFKRQHRNLWVLLTFLWILGLAQGVMGWIMVKSGLVHDPHVSPYRLAAHLLLGFAIFGAALWMVFKLYQPQLQVDPIGFSKKAIQLLQKLFCMALFLVLMTAFFGALVAGLKAGLLYNTFPLMEGQLIPSEVLTLAPWWKDLFENSVTIQLLHRFFAIITLIFCGWMWAFQRGLLIPPALSSVATGVILVALVQFSLGLLTLLFHVPITLALLHQTGAFILFGSLLYGCFLSYIQRISSPFPE